MVCTFVIGVFVTCLLFGILGFVVLPVIFLLLARALLCMLLHKNLFVLLFLSSSYFFLFFFLPSFNLFFFETFCPLSKAKFNKERGFRRVFNAMAESKLPIVGHNVMYDLLFTLAAFEQPLPGTYVEFVALLNGLFPAIIDTKFMAHFKMEGGDANGGGKVVMQETKSIRSTVLGDLYKDLDGATAVSIAEGFGQYSIDSSDQYHEARASHVIELRLDRFHTSER